MASQTDRQKSDRSQVQGSKGSGFMSNLPRQCHVTARGKTRKNNLIAYEQDQRKKGNPER
jgi:hypothetical protein